VRSWGLNIVIFGLRVGWGGSSLDAKGGVGSNTAFGLELGTSQSFQKSLFQAQGAGCEGSDVRPIKLNNLISEIGACFMGCDMRQCRLNMLISG
jgi:hypothetical protein